MTDLALAALLVVLGSALLTGGDGEGRDLVRAAATWTVAVSMAWRRSHPVAVAVLAVLAVALGAVEMAVAVAFFSLAIRRRDRVLLALALAGAVNLAAAWVRVMEPPDLVTAAVGVVLTVGFFLALPAAAGAYVGARRELETSLRERAERLEAEQRLREEQARLAERSRIAGEMHDALGHRMTLLALHAGGLEVNPDLGAEKVGETATLIGRHAREALGPAGDPGRPPRRRLRARRRGGAHPASLDEGRPGAGGGELRGGRRGAAGDGARRRTARAPRTDGLPGRPGRTDERAQARPRRCREGAPGRSPRHDPPRDGREPSTGRERARPPPLGGGGTGIAGLTERVRLVGGTLEAGPGPDGGFVLRPELPWPT